MNFLIDNNLSFKIASSLSGSVHVRGTVGVDASDSQVWNFAKDNSLVILTKDNDFDEISQIKGCPPKVVHLNCGNKSTSFIISLLNENKKEIEQFIKEDNGNCLMKIYSI